VRFRACRPDDLPALEWMGLHAADRPIIEAAFAAQERGEALMLVGESGGFPVAQAWIDFADRGSPEWPHLWAVRVFPPLRGAGLGAALIAAAERHAAERGAHGVELGVEPNNRRARRFYQRLGFEPAGSRAAVARRAPEGRVARTDPDQLIMRKELRRPALGAPRG
jgi:ribosomal protein S18 acetylase RimI-like enzyme